MGQFFELDPILHRELFMETQYKVLEVVLE